MRPRLSEVNVKYVLLVLLIVAFVVPVNADTIWYVNSSGQSLSMGYNSCPVLSSSQPYGNLTIGTDETTGSFMPLVEVNSGSGCETPVSGLANTLTLFSTGQSQVVCATHHGVPGVGIASLNKGTAPYGNSLTAIQSAKTNAEARGDTLFVLATVWTQGESDQGMTSEQYKAALVQLQSDYETDIKAITGQTGTVPLVISQIGYWYGSSPAVALGQFQAAMDHPDKIILALPLYTLPRVSDNVHLTNVGSRRLGEYFANVLWYMRGGKKWVPLVPKSITLSGPTITIQCHVPVQPLVIDTSTIAEAEHYGFTFTDGSGSPPAITSVTLTASDTITIQLASAPSGASPRVQYADYQTYYSTGNIRDSSTVTGAAGSVLRNWMPTWDLPVGYTWEPISTGCLVKSGDAAIFGASTMVCK